MLQINTLGSVHTELLPEDQQINKFNVSNKYIRVRSQRALSDNNGDANKWVEYPFLVMSANVIAKSQCKWNLKDQSFYLLQS